MKNNYSPQSSDLHQTGVVYQFNCTLPHCMAETYIGMTQATITHRLINHTQSGSIFKHFNQYHNSKPTREFLINNTTIIAKADNRYKLAVKEALLILNIEPSINKQFDNMSNILKLYNQRKSNVPPETHRELKTRNRAPNVSIVHVRDHSSTPILSHTNNQHPSSNGYSKSIVYEDNKGTNEIDKDSTIPDMFVILKKFGIDTDFKEIDLDSYHALIFDDEELSIGQRVKSRKRTAQKRYT